jgi:hypothetical protein
METIYQLVMALAAAAAVISLFCILRLAMRAEATPDAIKHDVTAYGIAFLLTTATAASLFYLAYALSFVVGGTIAFFATFAIHLALLVLFSQLFPVKDADARTESQTEARGGQRLATGGANA